MQEGVWYGMVGLRKETAGIVMRRRDELWVISTAFSPSCGTLFYSVAYHSPHSFLNLLVPPTTIFSHLHYIIWSTDIDLINVVVVLHSYQFIDCLI
jgi:hypothetical protein